MLCRRALAPAALLPLLSRSVGGSAPFPYPSGSADEEAGAGSDALHAWKPTTPADQTVLLVTGADGTVTGIDAATGATLWGPLDTGGPLVQPVNDSATATNPSDLRYFIPGFTSREVPSVSEISARRDVVLYAPTVAADGSEGPLQRVRYSLQQLLANSPFTVDGSTVIGSKKSRYFLINTTSGHVTSSTGECPDEWSPFLVEVVRYDVRIRALRGSNPTELTVGGIEVFKHPRPGSSKQIPRNYQKWSGRCTVNGWLTDGENKWRKQLTTAPVLLHSLRRGVLSEVQVSIEATATRADDGNAVSVAAPYRRARTDAAAYLTWMGRARLFHIVPAGSAPAAFAPELLSKSGAPVDTVERGECHDDNCAVAALAEAWTGQEYKISNAPVPYAAWPGLAAQQLLEYTVQPPMVAPTSYPAAPPGAPYASPAPTAAPIDGDELTGDGDGVAVTENHHLRHDVHHHHHHDVFHYSVDDDDDAGWVGRPAADRSLWPVHAMSGIAHGAACLTLCVLFYLMFTSLYTKVRRVFFPPRPAPADSTLDPALDPAAVYGSAGSCVPEGVRVALENGSWQRGRLLGRGGFGSVYLGVCGGGELVAVKVVPLAPGMEDRQLRRLTQEVKVLSELDHPNIVKYHGCSYDTRNTELHMFMEYMDGGTLGALVRRLADPLKEAAAARFLAAALSGIAHLHGLEVPIVHRDVKGDNLLLSARGVAKLADFGACRYLCFAASATRVIGTPLWMAPETIQPSAPPEGSGSPASSTAADIWSVGILLCELLGRGQPPWPPFDNPMQALFAIGKWQDDLPPRVPEGLSDECMDFLRLCLSPKPERRATAAQLLKHRWLESRAEECGESAFVAVADVGMLHRLCSTRLASQSSGTPATPWLDSDSLPPSPPHRTHTRTESTLPSGTVSLPMSAGVAGRSAAEPCSGGAGEKWRDAWIPPPAPSPSAPHQ